MMGSRQYRIRHSFSSRFVLDVGLSTFSSCVYGQNHRLAAVMFIRDKEIMLPTMLGEAG